MLHKSYRILIFGLIACLTFSDVLAKQQETSLLMLDSIDVRPLFNVQVRINNSDRIYHSNEFGICTIPLAIGPNRVTCQHPAYRTLVRTLNIVPSANAIDRPDTVRLYMQALAQYRSRELVVFDVPPAEPQPHIRPDIESVLAEQNGIHLIRRAGFAAEACVNGMRTGQNGLTIDGMQIHGACVDHMDPAAAYVEPQNLAAADIARENPDLLQTASIGGGINLRMLQAPLAQPWRTSLDARYALNGRAANLHASISGGDSSLGFLASLATRSSEDFHSGGGDRVHGSAYQKSNIHVASTWRWHKHHTLRSSIVLDFARDVGYPSLIMDARRADAWIGSLTHSYRSPGSTLFKLESRVYANSVEHWMDDYDRSESQIRARIAMPNMNMPMFGRSTTVGLGVKADLVPAADFLTILKLDVNRRQFDADMRMINIDDKNDQAFVRTIADYIADNIALAVALPLSLGDEWFVETSARLEIGKNDLRNSAGRAALEASTGSIVESRVITTGGLTAALQWNPSNAAELRFSAAAVRRAPSPIELYGNLLFEVSDGYFYLGNPNIRPEQALQTDLRLSLKTDNVNFNAGGFVYLISDVIGGTTLDSELRQFSNNGDALRMGLQLESTVNISSGWSLHSGFQAYYGQNLTLDDPLGFIPQPEWRNELRYARDLWMAAATVRSLFEFSRTSRLEPDSAPAAAATILDLRAGRRFFTSLNVSVELANVFDTWYTDRLSVGSLAHPGRSLSLSCRYVFE